MLRNKIFSASSIGAKIIWLSLFGIFGLLTSIGVNKYLDLSIDKHIKLEQTSATISEEIIHLMLIEERFIGSRKADLLLLYQQTADKLHNTIEKAKTETDDANLKKIVSEIASLHIAHVDDFGSVSANLKGIDSNKKTIFEGVQKLQAAIDKAASIIDEKETELNMEGDLLDNTTANLRREIKGYLSLWYTRQLNLQNLLLFSTAEAYQGKEAEITSALERDAKNIEILLKAVKWQEITDIWRTAVAGIPKINDMQASLFKQWGANLSLMRQLVQTGNDVRATAEKITEVAANNALNISQMADKFSIVVAIFGLLGMAVFSFFIYRAVNNPLNRAISTLTHISQSLGSTSEEISSSGQILAEGSSEQAAALEETSASLEEMASMTQQNADNAQEADGLMDQTKQVFSQANSSMLALNESMREIEVASEKTSKIIKTIDEIAFQTNLLALNAAVEAARAGEAGAGFAVVADEVRNLAMRAAEAAKDTADLIDDTVTKVKGGAHMVGKTTDDFGSAESSTVKVSELVGEIAAASQEQAQGIGQVNKAVTEMDQVVQQNAATAEESASSALEMKSQSGRMERIVDDLVKMVKGGSNGNRVRAKGNEKKPASAKPQPTNQFEKNPSRASLISPKLEVPALTRPQLTPLEKTDFSDF